MLLTSISRTLANTFYGPVVAAGVLASARKLDDSPAIKGLQKLCQGRASGTFIVALDIGAYQANMGRMQTDGHASRSVRVIHVNALVVIIRHPSTIFR